MQRFFFICTCLFVALDLRLLRGVLLHGPKSRPRLLFHVNVGHTHQTKQLRTVLFLLNSEEVVVGGTDLITRLNTSDYNVKEVFHFNAIHKHPCPENHTCKNVISVIERFDNGLFVCGRSEGQPKCWTLDVSNQTSRIVRSYDGSGISPVSYKRNSVSLVADGDLYAGLPLGAENNSFHFERKMGNRNPMGTRTQWFLDSTIISATWVKQVQNPNDEKIYFFFRDKIISSSPVRVDPYVSLVARVCKVDEERSRRLQAGKWRTFLKTRLFCGFPDKSIYFNYLHDVYVVHDDNWADTRIYSLFSNHWNHSAVCVHTIGMIEHVFKTSGFKGDSNDTQNSRSRTCQSSSSKNTMDMTSQYQEMADWVHPQNKTPIYISKFHYTKIVVDQVQAADRDTYDVILLATDDGKIHKVVDTGSEPFVIAEMHLSSSTIHAMKLDTEKKKLIVGTPEKVFFLDLKSCQNYKSCADCVLAQDPYCAWTESGCSPAVLGGIQNVKTGQYTECFSTTEELNRHKWQIHVQSPKSVAVHTVPLSAPFYLTCPIESYHAVYYWEHNGRIISCKEKETVCLILIPAVAQEHYGTYNCKSEERDYKKLVKRYELIAPLVIESSSHTSVTVSLTLLTILELAIALFT